MGAIEKIELFEQKNKEIRGENMELKQHVDILAECVQKCLFPQFKDTDLDEDMADTNQEVLEPCDKQFYVDTQFIRVSCACCDFNLRFFFSYFNSFLKSAQFVCATIGLPNSNRVGTTSDVFLFQLEELKPGVY